nr:MAG TPA: hypothetical protein [Caudoviricetes sp.]
MAIPRAGFKGFKSHHLRDKKDLSLSKSCEELGSFFVPREG